MPYELASFVTTYAPLEYYHQIRLIESITIEEKEVESFDKDYIDEIISEPVPSANEILEKDEIVYKPVPSADEILENYDPRLCRLLQGARYSLASDNPDRVRHVTTSIRELFTHVLHTLAPDNEIRKWSTEDQYFHNNRPTRRARISYIYRNINSDPCKKFVKHDIETFLSLFDVFNGDTHSLEPRLAENQLEAIVWRVESLLIFLLQMPNICG
jgi:hypothetical protein